MILDDVAFVMADSTRSRAYLQAMIRAGLFPGLCIYFGEDRKDDNPSQTDLNCDTEKYFDPEESIFSTVKANELKLCEIHSRDVNSAEMREALGKITQRYLVYSGYGGGILKPFMFTFGKKYIHVHAGLLPKYRGSTTAYYSILQENHIGATAIFLNEKIDAGNIIAEERFPVPAGCVNIDYIYDPWVRSQVLVKALKKYAEKGTFSSKIQNSQDAETYYIIHPVLKHLAMLKIRNV